MTVRMAQFTSTDRPGWEITVAAWPRGGADFFVTVTDRHEHRFSLNRDEAMRLANHILDNLESAEPERDER